MAQKIDLRGARIDTVKIKGPKIKTKSKIEKKGRGTKNYASRGE